MASSKLTKRTKSSKSGVSTGRTQSSEAVASSSSSYEGTIASVYHFLCLVLYTFIFFYRDITGNPISNDCKSLFKLDIFGGHYKYLTDLTMHFLYIYFIIAFLADVIPFLKEHCRSFIDWFFTTLVWTLSWVVFWFFWGLYAIDRELIFPEVVEKCVPNAHNHLLHTVLFPVVVLELLLVCHKHSSFFTVICTLISASGAYTAWICLVYYMTGFWVYPFMKFFSPFTFALFIVVSAIISGVFYYIGKGLCWLRHGVNSI